MLIRIYDKADHLTAKRNIVYTIKGGARIRLPIPLDQREVDVDLVGSVYTIEDVDSSGYVIRSKDHETPGVQGSMGPDDSGLTVVKDDDGPEEVQESMGPNDSDPVKPGFPKFSL